MRLRRLIRFGLVGVINTGVYYGLYLLFHTMFVYLVAHVIAFTIAMIGSYFLNCFFTFKIHPGWRTFLLFPLSNLTNFVFTTVGLGFAVETLGINSEIAPLVVAAFAIPVTYVVAHYIMLGRKKRPLAAGNNAHTVIATEPTQS